MNLRAAPAVFSCDLDNRNGVLSTTLPFSFLDPFVPPMLPFFLSSISRFYLVFSRKTKGPGVLKNCIVIRHAVNEPNEA